MHIRDWFVVRASRFASETTTEALVADERFRVAVAIASPSLATRLREAQDVEGAASVWRYAQRARFRATPFGLFAGATLGGFAAQARLALPSRERWRVGIEPALCALTSSVLAHRFDDGIDWEVRLSTLAMRSGDEWFVPQRGGNDGKEWTETALAHSEALDAVVRAVGREAVRLSSLASRVARALEVDAADAEDFVRGLLRRELLVPTALPPAAHRRPAEATQARLLACAPHLRSTPHAGFASACAGLDGVAEDRIDVVAYEPVRAAREAVAGSPDEQALYASTHAEASEVRLPHAVRHEVQRFLNATLRMPKNRSKRLAVFRDAFMRRYEQRWVPLLEAVHDYAGIGAALSGPDEWSADPSGYRAALTACIHDAEPGGPVDLTSMIDAMPAPADGAIGAQSFAILTQISGDPSTERFLLVEPGAYGASAAFMLGRFSRHGDALQALAQELMRDEQRVCDEELVEVLSLPLGFVANPHAHSRLRARVLEASATSESRDGTLVPEDVEVTVRGDHVRLRSRVDGRALAPRFSCAIAASNPRWHRVVDFLYLVANEGVPGNGPLPLPGIDERLHTPRVVYGRCVLRAARWMLPASAWRRSRKSTVGIDAVRATLERLRLPERVEWAVGDERLLLDWRDDAHALRELARQANLGSDLMLREHFASSVLRSEDGTHAAEFVFIGGPRPALDVRGPMRAEAVAEPRAPSPTIGSRDRLLTPASACTYVKIYADDRTLAALVPGLARALASHRRRLGIEHWHSLYFSDPDPHLRLRVFRARAGSDAVLRLVDAVVGPYLECGRVWQTQLATYQREIERYGGLSGVMLAERIYAADSVFAASAFAGVPCADDARIALAAASIGRMLDDFGLDRAAQHAWLKRRVDDYASEMKLAEAFRESVASLQSAHRQTLRAALAGLGPDALNEALSARSRAFAACARELGAGGLSSRRDELLASYVHLGCARVFVDELRYKEAQALELLRRERATEAHLSKAEA